MATTRLKNRKTVILYKPRAWTKALHESQKRWRVVVAHRRSGKTVASINHLIRDALKVNKSKYAYIAPTYKQAKNVAWDILKEYCLKIHGTKFNESELRVDFQNGSRITLYGADNPDSLRGLALWGVVFDEYSQQPGNIFTEVIRPALADHKGYAIWIGTPKGKNDFYKIYEHAKSDSNWLALKLTVKDTKLIDDDELEDSRRIMSQDEYDQEWFCSFEAHIKGAVYADEITKMRAENRIVPISYELTLPTITAWDLGINDNTVIGIFQKTGNEVRMIDCISNFGKGLEWYVKELEFKGYRYSRHILPHDVQVRELGTGKSRYEVLDNMGLQGEIEVCKNLTLEDGINAVKLLMPKLWINEQLEAFLDALSQYRRDWDDKLGRFRDKPTHDWTSHYADMLRYFAVMDRQDFIKVKRPQVKSYDDYKWDVSTY